MDNESIKIRAIITKRTDQEWTRDQRILLVASTEQLELKRSDADTLCRKVSLSLDVDMNKLNETIVNASKTGTDEHVNTIVSATNNFDGITDGTVVVDFNKGNVSKVTVSKVEFNG